MLTKLIGLLFVVALVCLNWITSPVLADPISCGNDIPSGRVERPNVSGMLAAEVIGQEPGSPVNVRAQPGLEHEIVAEVLVGDRVLISARQYVALSNGEDAVCEIWYFVQDPTNPLGWVRGDFIMTNEVAWSAQR